VSVSDGLRRAVGVEVGEIADEILVGDAQLSGERLDELIVVVKAADTMRAAGRSMAAPRV
jgi:ribosomal protein L12E/L44/L45/RPP1/RPP2